MPSSRSPHRPAGGARLTVALCTLAYLLSNVDRQIIGLLIKPIEADLHLSDTQFGLLQGLAFALLYATVGIPIAAAADRASRPMIMGLGIAVWSLATAACGFARSFPQILLARATVGVGEAALSPAAYSLIADLFPRAQLGRATGFYSLGSFLGATCAFLIGGALIAALGEGQAYHLLGHDFHGWQIVFLIVGLPGLPLAAAVASWVAEPRRSREDAPQPNRPGIGATWSHLACNKAIFVPLLVGYPLYATALYVLLGWSPAFLIRVMGYTTGHAGTWLGLVSLTASGAGVMLAGTMTDHQIRRGNSGAPFGIGILGAVGLGLSMLMLALLPIGFASLAFLACGLFFAAMPMAPSIAVIQIAVPPAMRSRVSALLLFCNNLIGLTCGNLAVGWLDDHALGGPIGVRLSVPIVVGGAALLAIPFLIAGRRPFARHVGADAL